jgi:hypothetical protein
VQRVLHDLIALGEASLDDLVTVMEELPLEVIQQSLRWADLLHLTIPAKNGCWRVDKVVARLLPIIEK